MSLTRFHGFEDSVKWRLTRDGLEVEGSGIERTKGPPATVSRVWDRFGPAINEASRRTGIPAAILVATVCTESGGDPAAMRKEPGYVSDEKTPHRISIGLTQTLLSTAREAMRMSFGRGWLQDAANALLAGANYIAIQAKMTRLDPPLVAAAYNAGRLYHQNGLQNRWRLRQFPIGTGKHCDRFVRFFNDAVYVLAGHSRAPAIGIEVLLGEAEGRAPAAAIERKSPDSVEIRIAGNANAEDITPYSMKVLRNIVARAELSGVTISSTSRQPADQARVMFDNLERHGIPHQRELYGKGGNKVIDIYEKLRKAGMPADGVKARMAEKIRDIGPTTVSRHASDPKVLNVFDVAPSSVKNKVAFERAVRAERCVDTRSFFKPPKDPGYHLEIPQTESLA